MSTVESTGRPGRLVNFEEAREKHGSKADLMAEALQIGDPLSDAVVSEVNELGKEAERQLNKGLTDGLGSLDNPPPAIAAFLSQLETMPEWIDRNALVAGDVAYLSMPPLWKALSSAGLLVHVYASPSIARLLVQTGWHTKLTPLRLAEAGLWKQLATLPGGLLRGASGYVRTAQVRLLHARIRAMAMTHGWDHAEWGAPINQVDVARTWLGFTTVPFLAGQRLGIVFTEEEQVKRYQYWSYLGYLLGLDARFYLDIRNDDDAEALLDLLDSTIAEPDQNSRLLIGATLEAVAGQLSAGPLPMVDHAALRDLLNGLVRYYFGDQFAEALHLPPAQSAGLIPMLAAAGAESWQLQRSTPEGAALALEQFTAMAVAAINKHMPDGIAYQTHLASDGDCPNGASTDSLTYSGSRRRLFVREKTRKHEDRR